MILEILLLRQYVCMFISMMHPLHMFVYIERAWPLRTLQKCPKCQKVGSLKRTVVAGEKRIVITCDGMNILCT